MVYSCPWVQAGTRSQVKKDTPKVPFEVLSTNRRAFHNFLIEEKIECGIALRGTEVKSLKGHQFSFTDSYAKIDGKEIFLLGLHITPYAFGNQFNHEPTRPRKLLAHREEIRKLNKKVTERGMTLIPLRFYVKKGIVKIELGVCRGKKLFDKRQDIKKRDTQRDLARQFRSNIR